MTDYDAQQQMRKTDDALDLIYAERVRQNKLKHEGRFKFTCADPMSDFEKLAVLMEEVGEVATAAMQVGQFNTQGDRPRELRKELVQVAAVALAWVEALL